MSPEHPAGSGGGCDRQKLLSRHSLFDGLEAETIERLADMCESRSFASGSLVFSQNDPSDGLHLVESGTVAMMARVPGDSLVELERLGPGSVFGEFCLLDGGLRSAAAQVMAETRILRVDRHRFDTALQAHHPAALEIRRRLMQEVARRTRVTVAALAACPIGALEGRASLPDDPAGSSGNETPDAQALLGGFPGFAELAPSDWPQLESAVAKRHVARGTEVAAPDETRDTLLIVGRGALRTGVLCDGKVRQMLLHGPGAIANVAAFIDGEPCPSVIIAREDTVLFELPRAGLDAMGFSPMADCIMGMLGSQMTRDLRRLTREVARLGCVTTGLETD